MAATSPTNDTKRMRSTTAFIVETLALLAVLVISMAVFTQLFSRAASTANESARLCQAVNVAEDVAEEFSANPTAVAAGKKVGNGVAIDGSNGFTVSCDVDTETRGAGTLYQAHIEVSDQEGVAYELNTSRYVSEVE